MAKKKKSKPSEAVTPAATAPYNNPVAVIFGRTLEKLRTSVNMEADQLAGRLGLKYSSYRLVETGAMPFRPARSVMLARAHDLDWRRVAEVVVVVQLVEDQTHSLVEMKDVLQGVFTYAPDLADVLAMPEKMWAAVERRSQLDALAAIALESGLVDRLHTYLRNDLLASTTPASSSSLSEVDRLINGVAPYYLETLTGVLESWHELLPPRITPKNLATFEVKNIRAERFVRILGLTRDPQILEVTLQHQHHEFTWEYLLQRHFEFLGILVLGTDDRSLRRCIDSLQSGLIKLWKRSHPALSEEELQRAIGKLHCKTVDPGDAVFELLEDVGEFGQMSEGAPAARKTIVRLNNVWLYRLRNPVNTIAYVDNLGSDAIPYTTSCSWDRTSCIAARLEASWMKKLGTLGLPRLFTPDGDKI